MTTESVDTICPKCHQKLLHVSVEGGIKDRWWHESFSSFCEGGFYATALDSKLLQNPQLAAEYEWYGFYFGPDRFLTLKNWQDFQEYCKWRFDEGGLETFTLVKVKLPAWAILEQWFIFTMDDWESIHKGPDEAKERSLIGVGWDADEGIVTIIADPSVVTTLQSVSITRDEIMEGNPFGKVDSKYTDVALNQLAIITGQKFRYQEELENLDSISLIDYLSPHPLTNTAKKPDNRKGGFLNSMAILDDIYNTSRLEKQQ
jgi:hypothetical protein